MNSTNHNGSQRTRENREARATARDDCPNCGAGDRLLGFYHVPNVPAHSVLLMRTREAATGYPKREIRLTFCQQCGFIFNRAFDPTVQEYSADYEETQGFSETFNAFSHRLAEDLIERHNLAGKRILEIGCGKGEFLTHVCELGDCTGIGFDPAYVPTRSRATPSDKVEFIQDFYSEKYAGIEADFVCCKMTLEHIHEPNEFVRMIRRSLSQSPDAVVFFQVPDVTRVLDECAFWDIYYEHCSYFSPDSLTYLFRDCGFDVTNIWTAYDGQYLMIEATPTTSDASIQHHPPAVETMQERIDQFVRQVTRERQRWTDYLSEMSSTGRRVALWGAGSKAVAFLTTLGVTDEVVCGVDVNPNKHGTFLPGSGHPIVTPGSLAQYQPDSVMVMNPIYMDEIRRDLDELGLVADVVPITRVPEPMPQRVGGGQ